MRRHQSLHNTHLLVTINIIQNTSSSSSRSQKISSSSTRFPTLIAFLSGQSLDLEKCLVDVFFAMYYMTYTEKVRKTKKCLDYGSYMIIVTYTQFSFNPETYWCKQYYAGKFYREKKNNAILVNFEKRKNLLVLRQKVL